MTEEKLYALERVIQTSDHLSFNRKVSILYLDAK